jgi:hypothetical protein
MYSLQQNWRRQKRFFLEARGKGKGGGGGGGQGKDIPTMYTHTNKCINKKLIVLLFTMCES